MMNKLVSCLELNCHNIRARLSKAKPRASTSGRAKRARPTANEGDGDDEDGGTEGKEDTVIAEIARGVSALGPKSKGKGKGKGSGNARAPKPNAKVIAAAAAATTSDTDACARAGTLTIARACPDATLGTTGERWQEQQQSQSACCGRYRYTGHR
jgi:hypothetical protein